MLHPLAPWLIAAALVVVVAVAQWRVLTSLHLKRLAAARSRHQRAQESTATLLQQARQQTAQVQQALSAARETAKRRSPAAVRPTVDSSARARLNKLLDDAPQAPALPANGFADTLPSRHFAASTTFGLLQRSSARTVS